MRAARIGAGFASAALLVAAVTIAARIFGFGRWLVFSPTVGAEGVGTAYQTANQLPNVLFEVAAGGALAGAIVPLLAGPIARGMGAETSRTASALLTWAVTILLPLSVLLAVFSRPLAGLLLSSAGAGALQQAGTAELAGRLLLIFSPQLVLYGIGAVLTGILQAHRRFLWPAFVPLLSSAVVMVAYVMYWRVTGGTNPGPDAVPATAEAWLGWGTTAGVVAISLPLLLPTRATKVRLRPLWRFPEGVARRAIRLAGAGIVALLAQQAAVLTTLWFANSRGGVGAYVVFNYVQAVYLLPYAVLMVPLATVAFPRLSELAAEKDLTGFAEAGARTTRVVIAAGGLGVAVLVAAAEPIGRFFVRLDAGGSSSAAGGPPLHAMGTAVVVMAVGLWGWGLVAHLSRALYALERGRAAATATGVGWLTVIAATVVFVLAFTAAHPGDPGGAALVGLAAGNSTGMLVAGALLLAAIARGAGGAVLAGIPRTFAVVAVAAGLGGLAGWRAGAWVTGLMSSAGAIPAAVVSGVLAALIAAVVVLGALLVADRSTAAALRSLR